ncbi:SDR family oxidoreductase [Mycolicibacterium celeriflavum]|uniref:LysR family transcriptional regulator n=1 Tax=Mycolicibacterium celeriflavum TaxID=1249101 RepID=A0A1X0BTJ9_MYCCF|nr:NAD(P)H-binding protein [Mycolicibacterium celeriflavum]MCV7239163.1 NAD(P)H-binding protein [Mycolicibacterium celeriflavum]ORA46885.1 NmrA family transcriptional regulator [Mycolicibacterium celeriflavum]BBY44465.1 LysR family transcriptional regulator [Mycolicibacterium celeriflavum]
MKVVVIGGTGLIGSRVVTKLNKQGHNAVAASPATGVDIVTGDGLAEVLAGAQVVVDVANSPSFEDGPAWDFFTTATANLLTAGEAAGVSHHVALSVVGTDCLLDSGYFRAKNAQEQLIKEAAVPFTIVRATQFFEFVGRIADSATDGDTVRITSALTQPMAADDVATAVARTAIGDPVRGTLEVGGPDRYPLDELVRMHLRAHNDTRRVITDPRAPYFGVVLDDHTLVPATAATVFPTHYADWLAASLSAAVA